jgi:hypothetical protein
VTVILEQQQLAAWLKELAFTKNERAKENIKNSISYELFPNILSRYFKETYDPILETYDVI